MGNLKGKVLGVEWQDIWWSPDEEPLGAKFPDGDYVHYTYGVCLRDSKGWITISHEIRPKKRQHTGTTSIPKAVIRSLKVYGDGISYKPAGKERARRAEPAAPGCGEAAQCRCSGDPQRGSPADRRPAEDRTSGESHRLRLGAVQRH